MMTRRAARGGAAGARATVASRPAASTPVPAARGERCRVAPGRDDARARRRAFERTSAEVKASAAADPAAFLAGDAATRRLPRKRGADDRVEAEKRKRANAQNGRGAVEWKSEAEMALRQQYD